MKDIPYTELPNNKAFVQHATSVEKKLNFAVDTLDDPDKLVNDFSELGKRHVQYNLTEDNFKVSKQAHVDNNCNYRINCGLCTLVESDLFLPPFHRLKIFEYYKL